MLKSWSNRGKCFVLSQVQIFFKAKFLSDVLPDYNGYVRIYTDGSKNDRKAAFAVCSEYGYKFNKIRNDSSIFTTEIEALRSALRYIEIPRNENKNCNLL